MTNYQQEYEAMTWLNAHGYISDEDLPHHQQKLIQKYEPEGTDTVRA